MTASSNRSSWKVISLTYYLTMILFALQPSIVASTTATATVSSSSSNTPSTTSTDCGGSDKEEKYEVVEGIALPSVKHINGVALKRNGHGVRSIPFLGMNVKVYVAGLYSPKPLLTEDDVWEYHHQEQEQYGSSSSNVNMEEMQSTTCTNTNNQQKNVPSSMMMQLDFTFLRSVGKSRVISAWTQQLEYSVSHRYDGYEQDRDDFINKFASPIAYGGTQSVQLIGNDTIIVDQGIHKGKIVGRNFQKAFLSMWFGQHAVAQDLKEGLLKGGVGVHGVGVGVHYDDDDETMQQGKLVMA